ncbi:DUF5994 family protein [Sphaerisporangium sp. NBC_01403]|uniref:DUF5994 family protein n=1 Tax=Sphaerisporangium sp. NBC_01403 TaxID=2903599 RepID=UPI00324A5C62
MPSTLIPPPHAPAASPGPAAEAPPVRLSLPPAGDHPRAVDGVWWPRSKDAAAELPGLIAAVDERLGEMTLRVGLHVDAWSDIPHRIPAPGRAVRVGWFRAMDPERVTLIVRGQKDVTLRVIPPEASAESAEAALAGSAASHGATSAGSA